jgi:hypothetical protein
MDVIIITHDELETERTVSSQGGGHIYLELLVSLLTGHN